METWLIIIISLIVFVLLRLVHTALQKIMGYRWWYRTIYLRTPHWRLMRRLKFLLYGRKCRVCGIRKLLDVHHREYTHSPWWEWLDLSELEVLCRVHHIMEHRR